MARLIDADAFITQYCEDCGYGCDQLFCATVRDLKNAPTVDAVEVVRCKDCKAYDKKVGYCEAMGFTCEVNDFCSYGEREAE